MRNIYILTVEKSYVDFQCLICIVLILKLLSIYIVIYYKANRILLHGVHFLILRNNH